MPIDTGAPGESRALLLYTCFIFVLRVFKVLDCPFMLFGGLHRIKSPQIPSFMRLRIYFTGIDPVLPRF